LQWRFKGRRRKVAEGILIGWELRFGVFAIILYGLKFLLPKQKTTTDHRVSTIANHLNNILILCKKGF